MPYSLAVGMDLSHAGLVLLANAPSLGWLLVAASFLGLGSAILNPEASRVARLASGGCHGLARSVFQVGGNAGTALRPSLVALLVVPCGQGSLASFALAALIGLAALFLPRPR